MAGKYAVTKERTIAARIFGAMRAEFVGTFWLVFLPTMAATAAGAYASIAGPALNSLAVAAAFGLTLLALVWMYAPVSGAHFNPAVTLGLLLTKQIKLPLAILYWIGQIAGGILGSGLTHLLASGLSGARSTGYGVTLPADGINFLAAGAIELIGTAFLVAVIMAAAVDGRSKGNPAIAISTALFLLVLTLGAYTGGAFNPARALGPMLWSGHLEQFPVYLIAELAGGVIGAFVHQKSFMPIDKPQ